MINELYTFSPGSFVMADEWNANFSALRKSANEHLSAIKDANEQLAFVNGDLSGVYSAVDNFINSSSFTGTSLHITTPNTEFYNGTDITVSQQLTINVEKINGEARVLFRTSGTRSLSPVQINYAGGAENINFIDNSDAWSGGLVTVVFLYETNNKLNVRMVKGL